MSTLVNTAKIELEAQIKQAQATQSSPRFSGRAAAESSKMAQQLEERLE